jgi:hypothetical protein
MSAVKKWRQHPIRRVFAMPWRAFCLWNKPQRIDGGHHFRRVISFTFSGELSTRETVAILNR